jgi:hypothetical protein
MSGKAVSTGVPAAFLRDVSCRQDSARIINSLAMFFFDEYTIMVNVQKSYPAERSALLTGRD